MNRMQEFDSRTASGSFEMCIIHTRSLVGATNIHRGSAAATYSEWQESVSVKCFQ